MIIIILKRYSHVELLSAFPGGDVGMGKGGGGLSSGYNTESLIAVLGECHVTYTIKTSIGALMAL